MTSITTTQSLAAIGLLVLIAYCSRAAGLLLMARIPVGPQARRFVDAMSSSVLIAVITPMIIEGDGGARLAAIVAGLVILCLRRPLLAIGMGMGSAALWRLWLA
ncbi:AzlD domain-containing protein [Modicisalibacter xianhensis]|uniref:AzlD domain-containing protein n=1 Tax=Modicisalibacter xianhensis TaxID=442341 RepID=UPI001063CF8F|nr:AzlD domain-containing protein [Halomonas xianhensis]